MASVVVYPADLSPPRIVSLDRRIIRFGSAPDNDVVLEGGGVSEHHAHVVYEKAGFTVAATDGNAGLQINAKKKKSAKLGHDDLIQLGDHLLRFVLYDQGLEAPGLEAADKGVSADSMRALQRFGERLTRSYKLETIVDTLLDELIALTGADKAFLILLADGEPTVHSARNFDASQLTSDDAISDTIVRSVLDEGRPLIVADALSHNAFKSSMSVVNLKLCSVMCVPLKARGNVLGLFYLGNDNIVNHFDEDLLEVVALFGAQAGLIIESALARQELELSVSSLAGQIEERRFGEIIGASDRMRDIFKKITRVATTDISVLVEGETGTGKELVARAIHQRSNRASKPFVVINCGAIPENLLESELFGHVRGAFTGAVATHHGKFQQANKGTLFLDEIGEMPVALQVKILRAIQEKTVCKVGDTKSESVDIRIVAATNKHLVDEVKTGGFREDLFYRLNVITLYLPRCAIEATTSR